MYVCKCTRGVLGVFRVVLCCAVGGCVCVCVGTYMLCMFCMVCVFVLCCADLLLCGIVCVCVLYDVCHILASKLSLLNTADIVVFAGKMPSSPVRVKHARRQSAQMHKNNTDKNTHSQAKQRVTDRGLVDTERHSPPQQTPKHLYNTVNS